MSNPLVCKGWAFPVGVDGRGGIVLYPDPNHIDHTIALIPTDREG